MSNPAYLDATKYNRWTGEIDKTLVFYKDLVPGPGLSFPRGFIRQALNIIGKDIVFQDNRKVLPGLDLKFSGKLRDYQARALQDVLKKDFGVLEASTGSGKTIIALAAIAARQQPTLILVHTKELLHQWRDRIAEFLSVDAGLVGGGKFDIQPITVAIINTAKNRLTELPDHFGQIIVDECFVAGTLVDGVPIETIQAGDSVNSYNHETGFIEKKKVLRTFKRKKADLLSVKIQGKEPIICTKNHPFYTPHGYLTADKLTSKLSVLCIDNQQINLRGHDVQIKLCSMRSRNDEGISSRQETPVVLPRMQRDKEERTSKSCGSKLLRLWKTHRVQGREALGDFFSEGRRGDGLLPGGVHQNKKGKRLQKKCSFFSWLEQKICFRADEKEQSNVQSCHCRENEGSEKSKWHIACLAREALWQWTVYTFSNSLGYSFGVADGISYQDGTLPGWQRFSHLLQGGCGKREAENCGGSGRQGAQSEKEKVAGSEERTKTQWLRVESVEIYERTGDERSSDLCSKDFVYNLEIEGNNNYFVDGILVHNCHRTPATMFSEVVQAFDCKYMLGLSATPYRRDGLTKLIQWFIGTLAHKIDPAKLQDIGAVLIPEIMTRETGFHYQKLLSLIVADEDRNQQIVRDVMWETRRAGTALVVTDRIEHCETLAKLLHGKKPDLVIRVLTGQLKTKVRTSLIEDIRAGEIDVVVATIQLIGEGFDCPGLSSLFLATPIKFSGRLIQVIGRILRPADGKRPRVWDYRDPVGPLYASANSRARTYKEMGWIVDDS